MAQKKGKTPPPAKTPENRENQLIELAYDLVEKRLREGTASAQETVHFLKLGNTRAQLEKQKLEAETRLLTEKQEALESAKQVGELYQQAIDAMKRYGGHSEEE